MNEAFHYPTEVFNLVVETIPVLCRSKGDVVLFFRGAGVDASHWSDLEARLQKDRTSLNKYEIARTILTRINEGGDKTLRERREILKRVTEFNNYSTCWPADQHKARGLVASVREAINIKDAFTRMADAQQKEARKRHEEHRKKIEHLLQRRADLASIKASLNALFSHTDPHQRGKALEQVLNRLFRFYGVLVKEDFKLRESEGNTVLEQIDGVIELDHELYLVEMKWWKEKIDGGDLAQHFSRVFFRNSARGIFISASDYCLSAKTFARDALQKGVFVLSELREFVALLEAEGDLKTWLRAKVQTAILEKEPHRPITTGFVSHFSSNALQGS